MMGILCFLWVSVVLVGIHRTTGPFGTMITTQIMKTFLTFWSGLNLGALCRGLGACHVFMTVGAAGHPEFQESECSLALNWTRQGFACENMTFTKFHNVTENHLYSTHII